MSEIDEVNVTTVVDRVVEPSSTEKNVSVQTNTLININKNNLSIGPLNIRSIRNKLPELEGFLYEQGKMPKIIIITETWLRPEDIQFYNLNNYQTIANCREKHRGGGVLMFIHNDIKYNLLSSELFDKSHLLLIQLKDFNLKICGYYRSEKTKLDTFFDVLDKFLEKNENMICFGDANFNLLTPNEANTQKYLNILNSNNFKILNETTMEKYTYNEGSYISIIDHIFSDNINFNKYKINITDVCFSDHRYLNFEYDFNIPENGGNLTCLKIDYARLNDELKNFQYDGTEYSDYTKFRNNAIQKYTKRIMIREGKNNKKQWIDRELKTELRKRKELFKMKKKYPNNLIYKSKFNEQKKRVKKELIRK